MTKNMLFAVCVFAVASRVQGQDEHLVRLEQECQAAQATWQQALEAAEDAAAAAAKLEASIAVEEQKLQDLEEHAHELKNELVNAIATHKEAVKAKEEAENETSKASSEYNDAEAAAKKASGDWIPLQSKALQLERLDTGADLTSNEIIIFNSLTGATAQAVTSAELKKELEEAKKAASDADAACISATQAAKDAAKAKEAACEALKSAEAVCTAAENALLEAKQTAADADNAVEEAKKALKALEADATASASVANKKAAEADLLKEVFQKTCDEYETAMQVAGLTATQQVLVEKVEKKADAGSIQNLQEQIAALIKRVEANENALVRFDGRMKTVEDRVASLEQQFLSLREQVLGMPTTEIIATEVAKILHVADMKNRLDRHDEAIELLKKAKQAASATTTSTGATYYVEPVQRVYYSSGKKCHWNGYRTICR